MELAFSSAEELYERMQPALRTKKSELERKGYSYISEKDIWEYLKNISWIHAQNLSLAQMVSDILNADNDCIERYAKRRKRNVYGGTK